MCALGLVTLQEGAVAGIQGHQGLRGLPETLGPLAFQAEFLQELQAGAIIGGRKALGAQVRGVLGEALGQ
ncbi:hypothetical protein [Deinococcus enclensis]|uniref:Uncharacterized protein n=1 Tax=Deinococcus enclensis TaxID=1049582 RepID=A0ABT9MBG1_9DEIO|nr:hypothetical protein [Deinococcus enclensis]MDP9763866.1 hypothetical protein [Deinococcus enclensis]